MFNALSCLLLVVCKVYFIIKMFCVVKINVQELKYEFFKMLYTVISRKTIIRTTLNIYFW